MNGTSSATFDADGISPFRRALTSIVAGIRQNRSSKLTKNELERALKLADTPVCLWTPSDAYWSLSIVKKHAGHLSLYGIDSTKLPEIESPKSNKFLLWNGSSLLLSVPYEERAVTGVIRTSVRMSWDAELKLWAIKPQDAHELSEFVGLYDIVCSREALEVLADVAEGQYGKPQQRFTIPSRLVKRVESPRGKEYIIRFPYDASLVEQIRKIPGRIWEKDLKEWRVRLIAGTAVSLADFISRNAFTIDKDTHADLMGEIRSQRARVEKSHASSSNIVVPGLGMELRPYQRAGVEYAIKSERCFIADACGLGKSLQALATVEALDAYPAIVVCKASHGLKWAQHDIAKALPGKSIYLVEDGSDTELPDSDFYVVSWSLLAKRAPAGAGKTKQDLLFTVYVFLHLFGYRHESVREMQEIGKGILATVVAQKKAIPGVLEALIAKNPKTIIGDECQEIKELKSAKTKAAIRLSNWDSVKVVLGLSATPMLNRPKEFLSQLRFLRRLDDLGGHKRFVNRFCDAKMKPWGLDIDGASNLLELNQEMRSICLVRRLREEVFAELPKKQVSIVPMRLSNPDAYRRAENDVIAWLQERVLEDKDFEESLKDLSVGEREWAIAEKFEEIRETAGRAENLIKVGVLRELLAKEKTASIIEWINDFLETGEKLVFFCYHVNMQTALVKAFPEAEHVLSGDNMTQRHEAVRRFQGDPKAKLIICGFAPGGTGWDMDAASHVAFGELDWVPANHEQAEDRLCRGRETRPVNVWYLNAPKTIDDEMWQTLEEKRVLASEATRPMIAEFLQSFMKRVRKMGQAKASAPIRK